MAGSRRGGHRPSSTWRRRVMTKGGGLDEVYVWLRQLKRRRRRRLAGQIAYVGYVAALIVGVYGGPLIVRLANAVAGRPRVTPGTADIVAALPLGLTATALTLALGAARNAAWRGPVLLSVPDAD